MKANSDSSSVPSACLTMSLFSPGMSPLHRAGLGGLACTLKFIEREVGAGRLKDTKAPGGPWTQGRPPWEIDPQGVTLHFGDPGGVREFLQRLFVIAFGIKDGLIYMPGQYGETLPSMELRAAIQDGLLRTFYDHGPQSRKLGPLQTVSMEIDGAVVPVSYPKMLAYKHRVDGANLALTSLAEPVPVSRMLCPGAVKRHAAFSDSSLSSSAHLLVPLLFAPVGVTALRMSGRRVRIRRRRVFKPGGALLIPDWRSLEQVHLVLPLLMPRSASDAQVASLGDAVLGAELRLMAAGMLFSESLGGVHAVWCCAADWDPRLQPRSRVLAVSQEEVAEGTLRRYDIVRLALSPRLRISNRTRADTSDLEDKENEAEWFWTTSLVRPLVTDNLAGGRRWYDGFASLLADRDTRNRVIKYEWKGLQTMARESELVDDNEMRFISAIHQAIYMARGRIYADTMGREAARRKVPANQATKKRWERLMERLRLDLLGAKTQSRTQAAISELLVRASTVKELRNQEALRDVKNLTFGDDWQRARNLALFAVASYTRPINAQPVPGDTQEDPESNNTLSPIEE